MLLLTLLIGIALLFFGRKVFWLFAGVAGFVAGLQVASKYIGGQPEWAVPVIAIAAGCCTALAAFLLQKVAVAGAGFIAGGLGALLLTNSLGMTFGAPDWILFVSGGILGAILMTFIFDWALIVLASIGGSTLIVQKLHLPGSAELALFLLLSILGIIVQARGKKKKGGKRKKATSKEE